MGDLIELAPKLGADGEVSPKDVPATATKPGDLLLRRVEAAAKDAKNSAITDQDIAAILRLGIAAREDLCSALAARGVKASVLQRRLRDAQKVAEDVERRAQREEARSVRAEAATDPAALREIRVMADHSVPVSAQPPKSGQLARIIPETIAALAQRDPNIFQNAGELVTIIREPVRKRPGPTCAERVSLDLPCDSCLADAGEPCERDHRSGRRMAIRPGTARLCSISAEALTERLAACAHWISSDDNGDTWTEADPPARVVAMVHKRREWGEEILKIEGILESPSIRHDGSIIETPGYDKATGYYYAPSCAFPKVPENPTREERESSLRRLWIEMSCDFPYRGMSETRPGEDTDRTKRYTEAQKCPDAFVALTMLLTRVGRPAFEGPAISGAFEASTQGSGKTRQIHAVAIVATGRPAGMATLPMARGVPNEEETEKVLAGYAIAGAQIVAFDNIKGLIGGAAIEKYQTAEETVDLRILGSTGQRNSPWSAIMMFSANNMTTSDDVAQRTLVSRLESSLEDPRSRPMTEFRHSNLLAALRRLRPSLLRDALIVLRAYILATPEEKRMADCGTLGSFEGWSALIPRAIRFAGGPNVLDARIKLGGDTESAESAAHSSIMRSWPGCFSEPGKSVKASELVSFAFKNEHAIKTGKEQDDGLDALRDAIRGLTESGERTTPNAVAFGNVLRGLRGKWRDGKRIVSAGKDRKGYSLWTVETRDGPQPKAEPVIVPQEEPTPAVYSTEYDPAEDFDR